MRRFWEIAQVILSVVVLVLLFYRNLFWMLPTGIPLILLACREKKKEWWEREKWQLNLEFREGLQAIAAALNAGYSIENALEESRKDVAVLYGEDSVLCRELQIMIGQLRLNQPVERVFDDFAERCEVEDIRSFVEVFRTARRSGGDLVAITRNCANRIGEKIEVSREIRTMIAGKQLEGRVMNLVPLGIILYFWICSPGYLDSLYSSVRGHLTMTIFLVIYVAAYALNQKICRIMM